LHEFLKLNFEYCNWEW